MIRQPYFTCYFEGSGDRWQAACVDFDLTVFGSSVQEVKRLLEYAVRTYVADAMNEAEPDRKRLLSRRSPWYTRLSWRANVIASRLGKRLGLKRPLCAETVAISCPA